MQFLSLVLTENAKFLKPEMKLTENCTLSWGVASLCSGLGIGVPRLGMAGYAPFLFYGGKMNSKIIGLLTCIVAVMSAVLYFTFTNNTTTTSVEGQLVEFNESDKIFTTFVYASTVDIKRDLLKRDVYLEFYKIEDSKDVKPVPVGTCSHEYEVGIGYQNINSLITDNMEAVCNNQEVELPEPELLSVNPTNSMVFGKYSRAECDKWITDVRGRRQCEGVIKNQLVADGNWKVVAKKSKDIIKSYIQIYCN